MSAGDWFILSGLGVAIVGATINLLEEYLEQREEERERRNRWKRNWCWDEVFARPVVARTVPEAPAKEKIENPE